MDERELWRELGQQLRVDAVRASAKAGSGHPTSSMSAADLAAVLLAAHLRYDFDAPHDPRNDRLVFSKGHASPLVYGLFARQARSPRRSSSRTASSGRGSRVIRRPCSLGRRRDRLARPGAADRGRDGARRQAAESPPVPHVGDLRRQRDGRGLDVGGGRARGLLRARPADRDRRREPARPARRDDARLGSLVVHPPLRGVRLAGARDRRARRRGDRRRLPRGRGDDRSPDRDRRAHDQGQGVLEGRERERLARQGDRGGGDRGARRDPQRKIDVAKPEPGDSHRFEPQAVDRPAYGVDDKVSTRKAYGEALAALGGERGDVVVLDGEVSNSTYAEIFREAHPERFVEMYIAEQQMIAAAVGMQVLGWKTYSSTFAAFLSRAYDFVRMAAVSQATLKLCGSHAGVSIGEDGPSQMGLEDLAEFRALNGSTVLYPCDGNQAARSCARWRTSTGSRISAPRAGTRGSCTRPTRSSPSGARRRSARGRRRARRSGDHAARSAPRRRRARRGGVSARVIDCYSVKPIDGETLAGLGMPIVTVEDHRAEGGLGEAVLSALAEHGASTPGDAARRARAAAVGTARCAPRGRRDRRGAHRRSRPRCRSEDGSVT